MKGIHPSAVIEQGARVGADASISANVYIRSGAALGDKCAVGPNSFIGADTSIGDRVTIEPLVSVSERTIIEDDVTICASATFAGKHPARKGSSTRNEYRVVPRTIVRYGAVIEAGSTIASGIEIGQGAIVAAGSVVTTSVPDLHLVSGSPAESMGAVCICGEIFHHFTGDDDGIFKCTCGQAYELTDRVVTAFPAVRDSARIAEQIRRAAAYA